MYHINPKQKSLIWAICAYTCKTNPTQVDETKLQGQSFLFVGRKEVIWLENGGSIKSVCVCVCVFYSRQMRLMEC